MFQEKPPTKFCPSVNVHSILSYIAYKNEKDKAAVLTDGNYEAVLDIFGEEYLLQY